MGRGYQNKQDLRARGIVLANPWELSQEQLRQCRQLTLRWRGTMAGALASAVSNKRGKVALLCDPATQQLLGWGLTSQSEAGAEILDVYVRANHRRQGLGKMILSHLLGSAKTEVTIHDASSRGFYRQALSEKRVLSRP